MQLLWVLWLVFFCCLGLFGIFRPRSVVVKPLATIILPGVLTFLGWLTNGRLAGFAVLGFVLALPLLLVVVLLRAGTMKAPTALILAAVGRLLIPALVFGGFIGGGIELGGRWSGSEFVVWRAFVGGVLVIAAGVTLFARATKPAPPAAT